MLIRLFCVAIATAELNMIPSNVLKLALFLQSNMGRGLFYILYVAFAMCQARF